MLKKNSLFNRKDNQSSQGFTLVELLVVMMIMALLASLALVSHRTGQKKYALAQAGQRLISDLRKAQNMAMSGVDIELGYCGYGLQIDYNARPTSYYFYADKADNCQTSNNKYDGSDDIIETVDLPNQVQFQSATTTPAILDIFFKPPSPTTYINQDDGVGVYATTTLEVVGTSYTKTITVTTAGLIQ